MLNKSLKKCLIGLLVFTIAVLGASLNQVAAQGERGIIQYPRDVSVETVNPATQMPSNVFCIGPNMIDVKLTNNKGQRTYIAVVNRDTKGAERTLYRGWLEPGIQYLSALLRMQLEVTGPAGMEMLRVDVDNYGQLAPGNWISFYVQNCGGPTPGGYAQLSARIYPQAIEQGKKGTILLQTNVQSQAGRMYSFEILNSWGQLWKRFPATKYPFEQYQVVLAAGKTTKPGMLTYTVNLWSETGYAGQRTKVATTQFSFWIVVPGAAMPPYSPDYAGGYPGMGVDPSTMPTPMYPGSSYGTSPSYDMPPSGMNPAVPYVPNGMPFYGPGANPMDMPQERPIE